MSENINYIEELDDKKSKKMKLVFILNFISFFSFFSLLIAGSIPNWIITIISSIILILSILFSKNFLIAIEKIQLEIQSEVKNLKRNKSDSKECEFLF